MTRHRQKSKDLATASSPLPESPLPAQVNQSLRGGIECLFQLVSADYPMGCSDMADALGMELTRVNRLLGTLAAMGIARRTRDRKYIPGPGLHLLSALSMRGSHLLSTGLPVLKKLAEQTASGVALGVLWQTQVCYLFHGKTGDLDAAIAPGNLYPAEQSSIGRMLLSHRPDNDVRGRFTDHADLDGFIKQLTTIRKQGYSPAPDGKSLAVAVDQPPIAALAVMNPVAGQCPESLIQYLHAAAEEIVGNMTHP